MLENQSTVLDTLLTPFLVLKQANESDWYEMPESQPAIEAINLEILAWPRGVHEVNGFCASSYLYLETLDFKPFEKSAIRIY